ncbi:hypothetical protein LFM09_49660 [Lentzea alba]|uniref:hypothetical protein n=1 Tax=Lentzea alba TaxID=2714351 RepID=UPI0039BF62CA
MSPTLVTEVGRDHRTGLDWTRTTVYGGGKVVVVGGVPVEQRMTIDDITAQMADWPDKNYDVRTRFAETIPLFSVVDRAVRVQGLLERQLTETGLLDFTAVAHIANVGVRPDLVLAAAVDQVRSGEHPNLFRGVVGADGLPAVVLAQIEITGDGTAEFDVRPATWAVPVVLAPTGEPLDPDTVRQVLADSKSARGAFQLMSQREIEDVVRRAAAIVAENHPDPGPDGNHAFESLYLALLHNVAVRLIEFGETAARDYSADIAGRLVDGRPLVDSWPDGVSASLRAIDFVEVLFEDDVTRLADRPVDRARVVDLARALAGSAVRAGEAGRPLPQVVLTRYLVVADAAAAAAMRDRHQEIRRVFVGALADALGDLALHGIGVEDIAIRDHVERPGSRLDHRRVVRIDVDESPSFAVQPTRSTNIHPMATPASNSVNAAITLTLPDSTPAISRPAVRHAVNTSTGMPVLKNFVGQLPPDGGLNVSADRDRDHAGGTAVDSEQVERIDGVDGSHSESSRDAGIETKSDSTANTMIKSSRPIDAEPVTIDQGPELTNRSRPETRRTEADTAINSGLMHTFQSTAEVEQIGAHTRSDGVERGRWSLYGESYSFGHERPFGAAVINVNAVTRQPTSRPPVRGNISRNGAPVEFAPEQVYSVLLKDCNGNVVGVGYPSEAAEDGPGSGPMIDAWESELWASRPFRTSDRSYVANWTETLDRNPLDNALLQVASQGRVPTPWAFRPGLSLVPFYVDGHGWRNGFKIAVNFARPGAPAAWEDVEVRGTEHARLLMSNLYFRALLSQPPRPLVYLSCETGAPQGRAAQESVGALFDAGYTGPVWAPTGRGHYSEWERLPLNPHEINPYERGLISAQSFFAVEPTRDSAGQQVAGVLRLVSNPTLSGWTPGGGQWSFRPAQVWTAVLRGSGGEVVGIGFPLHQDDLAHVRAWANTPHRNLDTIYTKNAVGVNDLANPERQSRAPWTNPFYIYATGSKEGYVTISIATPVPNGDSLYSQIRVNGINFGRLIGSNGFFQTASSVNPSRDVVNVISYAGHHETGMAYASSAELRQLGHVGGFYGPTGRITNLIDRTGGHSWHGVAPASGQGGRPADGRFVNVLALAPLTYIVADLRPWTNTSNQDPSNSGPSRTGRTPHRGRDIGLPANNVPQSGAPSSRENNYQVPSHQNQGFTRWHHADSGSELLLAHDSYPERERYSLDSDLRFEARDISVGLPARPESRQPLIQGLIGSQHVSFVGSQVHSVVWRDRTGNVVGISLPTYSVDQLDKSRSLEWGGRPFRNTDHSYITDLNLKLHDSEDETCLRQTVTQRRTLSPWMLRQDLSRVPFYVHVHGLGGERFSVWVNFASPGTPERWSEVAINGEQHARLLMSNHFFRALLAQPARPVVYLSCQAGAPGSKAARESVGALVDAGYRMPVWAPTGTGIRITPAHPFSNPYEPNPGELPPVNQQSFYGVVPTVDEAGHPVHGVFRLVMNPILSGREPDAGSLSFRSEEVLTTVLRGSTGEVIGIGFPANPGDLDYMAKWAKAPYRHLDRWYTRDSIGPAHLANPDLQSPAPWNNPFYIYATGVQEKHVTISIVTPSHNGRSSYRQIRVNGKNFGRLIGSSGYFQTASSVNPARDIVHVVSSGKPNSRIVSRSSRYLRRLGHLGSFYTPTGRMASLMDTTGEHSWNGVTATIDRRGRPAAGEFVNALPAT